jgi:rubrerythrin
MPNPPYGRCPVYYCRQCAVPYLAQDLGPARASISNARHCPRCGSGSAKFLKQTLYGLEYRCRSCQHTYEVAFPPSEEPSGSVLPVITARPHLVGVSP